MDYKKHYDLLMRRAQHRTIVGYCESHHIIPRCVGGSDVLTNLANLTPEEHFLAHLLLVKIYPLEPKLVFAAHMMSTSNNNHRRQNNKVYGWLRKRHASYISDLNSGNIPPNLGKSHSDETKRKISEGVKRNNKENNKVPWNKGTIGAFSHSDETKRRMSESKKGKPGRKQSEDTKRKISEKMKLIRNSQRNE